MLIDPNIIINQKQIRLLLKKTTGGFISKGILCRILDIDNKKAIEILAYLEDQGFIEKATVNGYWQQSLRGKLLTCKSIGKEYRIETLKQHLRNLIERVETINLSEKYPD